MVHGLWKRNYKDLLKLVKAEGFNLLRLPFSNSMLAAGAKPNSIDYTLNPDLTNLTSLEVMDQIIAYAGSLGLKVMLDRHRPTELAASELWYTPQVSESKWIADWVMLAKRYAGNQIVVAPDLHNEPHGAATWGSGVALTDWRLAAERAGNQILLANPDLLVVVEGVQTTAEGGYWWGGNLSKAVRAPVKLKVANRVVYSPHDYPASVSYQSWFSAPNYPANLAGIWESYWGHLVTSRTAPVLVGEFGTKLLTGSDRQWLETLVAYLKSRGISFTFWTLNPNSGDTGGILQDDWVTVDVTKLELVKRAM